MGCCSRKMIRAGTCEDPGLQCSEKEVKNYGTVTSSHHEHTQNPYNCGPQGPRLHTKLPVELDIIHMVLA
ncbi:hypothetical protein STEG23_000333, partial [Scotinomys teguina]